MANFEKSSPQKPPHNFKVKIPIKLKKSKINLIKNLEKIKKYISRYIPTDVKQLMFIYAISILSYLF